MVKCIINDMTNDTTTSFPLQRTAINYSLVQWLKEKTAELCLRFAKKLP